MINGSGISEDLFLWNLIPLLITGKGVLMAQIRISDIRQQNRS